MDEIFKATPLDTVQFISIFSYLNTLSDFLFIENYLAEDDQTKQIPIVNGLYQYFEDHRNNQSMQLKLIRSLLKGSDLYGEKDNENLDVVFVNAMFDHIISSLVFDKFENIYGFIAEVVRKADNLQIDSICEKMKSTLQSATFENEYGDPSYLTSTAADRIFNDIILPLFPQPKTNLTLNSIDYIYAQAGSIFLRPGRINTTYYTDTKTYNVTILDEEQLFDEYFITGHILDSLLVRKKIDFLNIKAFALPAVCYYVSQEKRFIGNTINIVTNPTHFIKAFELLFAYLDDIVKKIDIQLKKDYAYQMHLAFSNFYTNDIIDNIVLNVRCSKFSEDLRITKFECNYITEWCKSKINDIGETYKKYDLKAVQNFFGKSLMQSLRYSELEVKLIVPDDQEKRIFIKSEELSYDLLQFYFPLNKTIEYYALMRENYTVTLIKEADNFTLFEEKLGSSFDKLLNYGIPKFLKYADESIDVFRESFIEYKKKRLQSYLEKVSMNQSSNVKWWKQFGLSLFPAYQYFSNSTIKYYNTTEIHDEINTILFIEKFGEGISSQLTQEDTRSFLTPIGTTFISVNVWTLIDKLSKIMTKREHNYSKEIQTTTLNFLEKLCFHIEVPGFHVTISSEKRITLLDSIIDAFKEIINKRFISVKNMLNNIKKLKLLGFTERDENMYIRVNNQLRKNDTRLSFFEIPIHRDTDVKCNIDKDLAGSEHTTNLKIPDWSENYTIDNHELLLKLRYDMCLENANLSDFDGRFRIDSIYNKKERHIIENGISIDDIVKNYNDQKARFSVTFEDYYAIRNFATTGFRRITGDTNEAKFMKSALYKLAIRQSDDPDGEFYRRLFKIESKPIHTINRTLSNIGNTFRLTKFTLTSVSKFSAIKLATMAGPGFKNILYEMTFFGPYLRGQIVQTYKDSALKAILLPGSEFEITTVTETQIEGLGGCLEVKLQFIHKSNEKYAWYKKIMSEISRIKF